jgi:amidase
MIDRREFLVTGGAAAASMLAATKAFGGGADVALEEATVAGLQSAMASGQTTARKVAEQYLSRIANLDKKFNSIIELNPDALAIADQMDRERKAGKVRGPLHGIPILLKDNIDTADKMKTTLRRQNRTRFW